MIEELKKLIAEKSFEAFVGNYKEYYKAEVVDVDSLEELITKLEGESDE